MSAHSAVDWRLLDITGLIVIVQAIAFKRFFWEAPLKHGPGFFFDVEVPEGFYEGAGARWLRAWHALILSVNLLLVLALVAIVLWGPWHLLAAWAGGVAVLHIVAFVGFRLYARAKLGTNPPVQSRVAVSLESRRIGDYLWWPREALVAGAIVVSWILILIPGEHPFQWPPAVILTYFAVGLFLFEIGVFRASLPPLPADRPEEYRAWVDTQRCYYGRACDITRWFLVSLLAVYALLSHGWFAAPAQSSLGWLVVALGTAFLAALVASLVVGLRRVTAMGSGLRPAASWSTPFRRARLMPRGWMAFFWAWFAGLAFLVVLSVR